MSVIVPSFARMAYLSWSLSNLLRLEPLKRARSEILVAHGSNASLAFSRGPNCQQWPCKSAQVRHIDVVALDASGIRVASRYFAAGTARNEVLLHVDDDLVPTEWMLQQLIGRVARESGFPRYPQPHLPGLYGPSSFFRQCGAKGVSCNYHPRGTPLVLTNLAATSREYSRARKAAVGGSAREKYASAAARSLIQP